MKVGSRARVLLQLTNSFPIVQMQVKLGPQVIAEQIGEELRDSAGLYFSVPRTTGTYNFTVFAKDGTGCTAETVTGRSIVVF